MYTHKQAYEKQAKDIYDSTITMIPWKIEAIHKAQRIVDIWMFGDLERSYQCDALTKKAPIMPINIYLKLSPTDDFCKDCMLFLEEIDMLFDVPFTETWSLVDDAIKAYRVYRINLYFLPHAEGRCRILETKTERLEVIEDIKREVICL